jgi:hypothetical protein
MTLNADGVIKCYTNTHTHTKSKKQKVLAQSKISKKKRSVRFDFFFFGQYFRRKSEMIVHRLAPEKSSMTL